MRTVVQGDANTRAIFSQASRPARLCEIFPKRGLRCGPPKTYCIAGRFRWLVEEFQALRARRQVVLCEPCGIEEPRHVARSAVAEDRHDGRAGRKRLRRARGGRDIEAGGSA